MAKLVVYIGAEVREYQIEAATTIGRHPDNTIQILEPMASRCHARITKGPEGYVLEDLKSANGTEVNGRKIEKRTLMHGDTIRIGNVRIIFEEESERKAAEDIGPTLVARREDVGLQRQPAGGPSPGPEPASPRPGRSVSPSPEPELSIMVPRPSVPVPPDRDRVPPRAPSRPVESPAPVSPLGGAHRPIAPDGAIPPPETGPAPFRVGVPAAARAEAEVSLMLPKPPLAPPTAPGTAETPPVGGGPVEHMAVPGTKPGISPAPGFASAPATEHSPLHAPPFSSPTAAEPQLAAGRTPPTAAPISDRPAAAGPFSSAGETLQPTQPFPAGPQAAEASPPPTSPMPPAAGQRIEPADFLLRVVAGLLDTAVLLIVLGGLAVYPIYAFVFPLVGTGIQRAVISVFVSLVCMILGFLYFAVQEGGSSQATIGKRLVKIRVMDVYGRPLTPASAAIRTICKAISALPCFLGFIWAAFSRRKQAWHDSLAGALVAMRYEEAQAAPADIKAASAPLPACHAYAPLPIAAPAPAAPEPPAAREAAMGRRCPNCGAAVGPRAKFCTECGAKTPDVAGVEAKCPVCGSSIRPGAKFCGSCGRKLA